MRWWKVFVKVWRFWKSFFFFFFFILGHLPPYFPCRIRKIKPLIKDRYYFWSFCRAKQGWWAGMGTGCCYWSIIAVWDHKALKGLRGVAISEWHCVEAESSLVACAEAKAWLSICFLDQKVWLREGISGHKYQSHPLSCSGEGATRGLRKSLAWGLGDIGSCRCSGHGACRKKNTRGRRGLMGAVFLWGTMKLF